jgi:LPXTG-motif cell wall-anchored protein
MGWFSNLTGSIGGGISNILGGTLAPIFGGANQLVATATNSAGAISLGGSQGANWLNSITGLFGGIGGAPAGGPLPPSQALTNQPQPTDNKTIMLIIGGLLVVGAIVVSIFKRKK